RSVALVFDGSRLAAAVPREAKILTSLRDAVQLARRDVVAHAVHLIVGEPELAVLRVEIHADRVADARGIDLAVLAVETDTDDAADSVFGKAFELALCRDIERLPECDIELV